MKVLLQQFNTFAFLDCYAAVCIGILSTVLKHPACIKLNA